MTQKNVIEVNDETFDAEVLASELPVLVDFGATWCGPCKRLRPIVDAIAGEQAGRLKVAAVDIDASPAVAKRYGVRAAPTLMVFRGGEGRARHVGVTTKERLLGMVESAAG